MRRTRGREGCETNPKNGNRHVSGTNEFIRWFGRNARAVIPQVTDDGVIRTDGRHELLELVDEFAELLLIGGEHHSDHNGCLRIGDIGHGQIYLALEQFGGLITEVDTQPKHLSESG
ncbi:hypothetical protein ACOQFL_14555 [Actinopolyspora sp. H202]|uniref:hypothetical protein n=1 Tax=Actinopolyspora sp. H202 TaxID=1500456 RepID=UPI003EE69B47